MNDVSLWLLTLAFVCASLSAITALAGIWLLVRSGLLRGYARGGLVPVADPAVWGKAKPGDAVPAHFVSPQVAAEMSRAAAAVLTAYAKANPGGAAPAAPGRTYTYGNTPPRGLDGAPLQWPKVPGPLEWLNKEPMPPMPAPRAAEPAPAKSGAVPNPPNCGDARSTPHVLR